MYRYQINMCVVNLIPFEEHAAASDTVRMLQMVPHFESCNSKSLKVQRVKTHDSAWQVASRNEHRVAWGICERSQECHMGFRLPDTPVSKLPVYNSSEEILICDVTKEIVIVRIGQPCHSNYSLLGVIQIFFYRLRSILG